MPSPFDLAWLIPLIPFLGSSLVAALLISFNRTMNRLSRPVSVLLITCFSTSTVVSGLLFAQELSSEVIKEFALDWRIPSSNIVIHLDFVVDKSSSQWLTIDSLVIVLLLIATHFILYGKKGYVRSFVVLGFCGVASLALSLGLPF